MKNVNYLETKNAVDYLVTFRKIYQNGHKLACTFGGKIGMAEIYLKYANIALQQLESSLEFLDQAILFNYSDFTKNELIKYAKTAINDFRKYSRLYKKS